MSRLITLLLVMHMLAAISLIGVAQQQTHEQVDPERIASAGQLLQDFRSDYYGGLWFQLGGSVAAAVGRILVWLGEDTLGTMLIFGGTIASVYGWWRNFWSFRKIGQAGEELQKATE